MLGPDAIDIAVLVSCLPRTERADANVILARFVRGLPVTEGEIRPALAAAVDLLYQESGMQGLVGSHEDTVAEAAEANAKTVIARRRRPTTLKAWEPGLRSWADSSGDEERAGTSTDDLIVEAYAPVLEALAGDVANLAAGVGPLVAAVGLYPALDAIATPTRRTADMLDEATKDGDSRGLAGSRCRCHPR